MSFPGSCLSKLLTNGRIAGLTAALGLVAIGVIAAALGLEVHQREPGVQKADGSYQGGRTAQTTADTTCMDANDTRNLAQTQVDPQEAGRLPQRDITPLVRVIQSQGGGQHESVMSVRPYTLLHGQAKVAADGTEPESPRALPAAAWTEIGQLWQAGKAEDLGVQKKRVKGREVSFRQLQFVLSDGTKVVLSAREPNDGGQPRVPEPPATAPPPRKELP